MEASGLRVRIVLVNLLNTIFSVPASNWFASESDSIGKIMRLVFGLILVLMTVPAVGGGSLFAQGGGNKNFRYSQNPKTKPSPEPKNAVEATTDINPEPTSKPTEVQIAKNEPTVNERTTNVVRNAAKRALPLTEQYLIGAGDVLFISLRNDSKAASYFTVLADGTIDYGLAGEMVAVTGLSTDEVEEILAEKIKLYAQPLVEVKVREFNSHKVKVVGLVENAGERSIQRESVPLFVIRADALVKPESDWVSIKRVSGEVSRYKLTDPEAENTLITSGDIVEFSSSRSVAGGEAIFVSGEVNNVGRIAFSNGLTLSQAIIVAGGLKKAGLKKAIIRRKNAAGMLESTEFNLKSITEGRTPDPVLASGDIVEVMN